MKAIAHDHAGHGRGAPSGTLTLAHDERSLRRKRVILEDGRAVLVDLPHLVHFETGDVLVLEDGGVVAIVAGDEPLLEIAGQTATHLLELIWHIGNRHLPCQIVQAQEGNRLRIGRDHVIADMLRGLGAEVTEITAPFSPARGAYGGHGHAHTHAHSHDHTQDHG